MAGQSEQDDVVRLAVAANPLQAHMWRQALEEENVRCLVVGEYLGEVFGSGSRSFVELWVHSVDLPRAEKILSAAREG